MTSLSATTHLDAQNPVTKALVFSAGDFVSFGPTSIGGGPLTVLIVARPDASDPLTRLWDFNSGAAGANELTLVDSSGGALLAQLFTASAAAPSGAANAPSSPWAIGTWCVVAPQASLSACLRPVCATRVLCLPLRPTQSLGVNLFPRCLPRRRSHIALSVTAGGAATIFVNGVPLGSNPSFGAVPLVSRMGYIGRGPNTGISEPWFVGEVANFQVRFVHNGESLVCDGASCDCLLGSAVLHRCPPRGACHI